VKRNFTLKFTSRSVGRNRIFCMKSFELVMCDSNFPGVIFVLGSEVSCMSGSVWR